MKIAVFSESPADEEALCILLSAVLGAPLDRVSVPASLRTHGWPSVRDLLPNTLRYLYYRTDADGLVVLADSDDSPLHSAAHDLPGGFEPNCRLCELRGIGNKTLAELSGKVAGRSMKLGIAMATPAIEAWWRCGLDVHAAESAVQNAPRRPLQHRRRQLKKDVYGTDRPSLPLAKLKMAEAATRLSVDIASLERNFPIGFGEFARAFRSW
jgi:hypothetical protein